MTRFESLIATFGIGLSLSACSYIPGTDANKIAKIERLIAANMKDPGSVIFTDTRITKNGTVCGYINAKNSFGAYEGHEGFLYKVGQGAIYEKMDTSANPGINASNKCDFRYLHPICMKGGDMLRASVDHLGATLDANHPCRKESEAAIKARYGS